MYAPLIPYVRDLADLGATDFDVFDNQLDGTSLHDAVFPQTSHGPRLRGTQNHPAIRF